MTNRLKGLDLIDKVPGELWTEVCNTVQEAVNKSIPKKKKCKKAKPYLRWPYKLAEERRETKEMTLHVDITRWSTLKSD